MARIDLKKTTVTFFDGTPSTPNQLSVRIGTGNITYTTRKAFVYVTDRGLLDTVRKGDEIPVDVKFEATLETYQVRSADSPKVSVTDFLKKTGNASGFLTAGADPCEPYAVTIEIKQVQNCGANTTETILISEFRYEKGAYNVKTGQISFSGKAKITTPTITRS